MFLFLEAACKQHLSPRQISFGTTKCVSSNLKYLLINALISVMISIPAYVCESSHTSCVFTLTVLTCVIQHLQHSMYANAVFDIRMNDFWS